MAVTFQDKVELIGKYKDKEGFDSLQKAYKFGKNIDSPKLNDAQRNQIKNEIDKLYSELSALIKKEKARESKSSTGAKKKTILGLASEIKKKENITWDKAKAKARMEFQSEKKKAIRAEKTELADFKKSIGKINWLRATTYKKKDKIVSTDIKKDKVIPALPSGKRYPKRGKTTNQYGTFDNSTKKPYWENRANRMDVNQPSKKAKIKLADGGSVDNMYVAVGEKDGYWTILSKPSSKEKSQKLLDLTALPKGEVGKVVSVGDAKSHKLVIGREYLKYAKGGEVESNFEVDDVVYNKKHNTIGIVRMIDDGYGEVKTDADGNVSVDDLEYYNPLKYTHQTEVNIAPSTKKEIEERMLWRPFSSKEYAKGGKIIDQYNDRTPKDIWNNLSVQQREHFLSDHSIEIEDYKNVREGSTTGKERLKWMNSDWDSLDKDVRNRFENHTRQGQYAKGGNTAEGKICYLQFYGDFSESLIDKLYDALEEEGIKVDARKEWHTKGYAEEFMDDKGVDVRFLVSDAKNPARLMKKILYYSKRNMNTFDFSIVEKKAKGGTTKRIKRMGC
jgi:hypothetical protein